MLIRLNGNGYSAAELHSIILNEIEPSISITLPSKFM
jgi:hypothetical protein